MKFLALQNAMPVYAYPAGLSNQPYEPNYTDSSRNYQLFCRAFEQEDGQAWTLIYQQYRSLIASWLQDAAEGALTTEETEDLVQEAIIRFWRSIEKRALPLADHFPHTGALLKYLKRCAITAFLDRCRQQSRKVKLIEKLQESHLEVHSVDEAFAKLDMVEQLELVHSWLRQQKSTYEETLIFHYSFAEGLSPREILSVCTEFTTVQEVYRTKKRLLKRIQRALRDEDG